MIAEKNNGMLCNEFGRMVLRDRGQVNLDRMVAINSNREDGSYRYIHSATYDQLISRFGLAAAQIAEDVQSRLQDT